MRCAQLDLSVLPEGRPDEHWYTIVGKSGRSHGEIQLKMEIQLVPAVQSVLADRSAVAPLHLLNAGCTRTANVFLRVVSGRNLKDKDTMGKQDPFCTLSVGDQQLHRTMTHQNGGVEPEWLQGFTFEIQWPHNNVLVLRCFDEDVTTNDLIGTAKVELFVYELCICSAHARYCSPLFDMAACGQCL